MPFDRIPGIDENDLFPTAILDALAEHLGLADMQARLDTLESPGIMMVWPKSGAVPTGYLECNGQAVSRTDYADLFAVIGVSEGSGDGSTTFNLPDIKGKVVVGHDSGQVEFDTVGETGGAKTHTLSVAEIPAHDHGGGTGLQSADHAHGGTTDGVGDHQHSYTEPNTEGTATGGGGMAVSDDTFHGNSTGAAGAHSHTFSTGGASANHSHAIGSQGGGGAHNNLQPYTVRRWIIKT